MEIKFIDFFAGIGGFREGLEREGFECVGWCEFDKFKQQAYRAVHDIEGEWFQDDITNVQPEDLPEADLYVGGFPCQSFSIAGKRGGFEDTRGTLFFEVARLARERKPKYLLLENVKGLLNHDKGNTFSTILNTMAELGYEWQYQVLNSKNFGVPQNRERVFIVANLRGKPRPKIFPFREISEGINKRDEINKFAVRDHKKWREKDDGVTNCLDASYYKFPDNHGARTGVIEKNKKPIGKIEVVGNTVPSGHSAGNIYNPLGLAPTIRENHGKIAKTVVNYKIRKLTPLETFRLQGFPDEWYHKCREEGISDTQMYRAAGDSVTVNIVQAIAKRLGGE